MFASIKSLDKDFLVIIFFAPLIYLFFGNYFISIIYKFLNFKIFKIINSEQRYLFLAFFISLLLTLCVMVVYSASIREFGQYRAWVGFVNGAYLFSVYWYCNFNSSNHIYRYESYFIKKKNILIIFLISIVPILFYLLFKYIFKFNFNVWDSANIPIFIWFEFLSPKFIYFTVIFLVLNFYIYWFNNLKYKILLINFAGIISLVSIIDGNFYAKYNLQRKPGYDHTTANFRNYSVAENINKNFKDKKIILGFDTHSWTNYGYPFYNFNWNKIKQVNLNNGDEIFDETLILLNNKIDNSEYIEIFETDKKLYLYNFNNKNIEKSKIKIENKTLSSNKPIYNLVLNTKANVLIVANFEKDQQIDNCYINFGKEKFTMTKKNLENLEFSTNYSNVSKFAKLFNVKMSCFNGLYPNETEINNLSIKKLELEIN